MPNPHASNPSSARTPEPIADMAADDLYILPASFGQRRLWFLNQLEPESAFYNVPSALRFDGPLDVEALAAALDALVARHEILRTTFVVEAGLPMQAIRDTGTTRLELVDLADLAPDARDVEARRHAVREACRPFDLASGPLIRATLLRLAEHEHRLLLTLHHIVCDAWSINILHDEIAALYGAFAEHRPSPLSSLPIQYADFAVWQEENLQGERLDRELDYWKDRLAGAPFRLDLPTDRPRPPVQSFNGARCQRVLPAELVRDLKALAERERATLFMVLLAAFDVLLARYSRQEEFLVGSPVAGRVRAELEPLVGPFINMLPLRARLTGDPTFLELLARVRDETLGAFSHQELPFEKLVEELRPERSLSHAPLFQVMFVLQNAPRTGLTFAELEARNESVATESVQFDLVLSAIEGATGLSTVLKYNTDLFDEATCRGMLGHYGTLLEAIAEAPESRLARLPVVDDEERRRFGSTWNASSHAYPRERGVHEVVAEVAARRPEAEAVACGSERVSYGELEARANRLANHLVGLGVGRESLVGVCLERSVEMVVALLGVLKAGGAYVPLDPSFPRERLAYMLEDSGAGVVVTERGLVDRVGATGAAVVEVDADAGSIRGGRAQAPEVAVGARQLAYVIYTSGSTGRPKGVMVEHRQMMNFLWSMREAPGFGAEDRMLAVTTLSFDIAGLELFLPLVVGGRVEVASREEATDGRRLLERLRLSGATVMQATPATWRMLIDGGWEGGEGLKVLCGGEALGRGLAEELMARGGEVWNLYGPTETTVWSTVSRVSAEELGEGRATMGLGRPIANTQVWVLDERMGEVARGAIGELWIGGEGVARGYLGREELTRERFVADGRSSSGRLYRTGDLVRESGGGRLEYVGRADHQVKVRGYRIELGEVEAVLREQAGVREAVVVAAGEGEGKRLVGYVVGDGRWGTGGELRAGVRERLPDYMVPAVVVRLDELPLTPNGKVDRTALPRVDEIGRDAVDAMVAPRDALELRLCKLWESLLGIESVGVDDDFFEIGGHSLLAVQLFARIEESLGKSLPLVTLFRAPTVAQLAAILREDGFVPEWPSLVPIQPGGSKPPLYCVHAAGMNVLFYRDLARRLGDDQPFYALQPQGLDGKRPRHERVEEMAAHYISEIRSLQPHGPYHVGGSSYGGTIAFEMARQLADAGERVGLVALFDTHGPGYPRYLPGTTKLRLRMFKLLRRFEHHVGSLALLDRGQRLAYVREKSAKAVMMLRRRLIYARKRIERTAYRAAGRQLPESLVASHRRMAEARRRFTPQPYAGKVTLFRATNQPRGIVADETLGWGPLAIGGLEIHEVPGFHADIVLEPRVRFLVDKLRPCLERAHDEGATAPSSLPETTLSRFTTA